MEQSSWDFWVEEALLKVESLKLLRPIRPIQLSKKQATEKRDDEEYEVFNELQPWDRSTVEVSISESFFQQWLRGDNEVLRRDDLPVDKDNANQQKLKKLVLFCGNDFLGLSSHPTIAKATAKAATEHGMGPRGSALICGYTNYHRSLESSLADLLKKEDCLLCPTGYAANTALMVAIGSIAPLLAAGKKPSKEEKIAIFSDALNHLSIIEGIYLAGRRGGVELFVYRHCDMSHLNELLTSCKMKKKVVVTDSLFSMDGDFAPMLELAELRKKHGFLLVIDDAHATFVCGENGGGVAEKFNCETDVDIYTGSLSKAAATLGGFIACSKKWKQFIQSRGRAFIFSTTAPVPFTSALHAAVIVARKETWRRKAIQERMREFHALTGIPITSHIISIVVRTEEKAVQASRYMVKSGFYVTPIRPPGVSPDSCRLRVTLTAAHTTYDIKRLAAALSNCINFQDISSRHSNLLAKL
ncbi:PREDICTED: 8-amino-7-oxononanoate synthase isoform X1 [Theobroma cacao]|uniref:8-amino-7-oxononanoate synthase isoform X1 n=1 Tax=Theobroma cacao TaxID=3641 RepID=A0AB32W0X6_THECC|nr:PREDICTED: 8-amino-7-oxononanoate synthase isoform X1 [Theobroma cacao]